MLLAKKAADGSLDMRYHHVNSSGELMAGLCNSHVKVLADGRYRLEEAWRWTSGDCSVGEPVLEESSDDARSLSKGRGEDSRKPRIATQLIRQP
jgi:hypothetical protein